MTQKLKLTQPHQFGIWSCQAKWYVSRTVEASVNTLISEKGLIDFFSCRIKINHITGNRNTTFISEHVAVW
jgi:hypothetical protein